MTTENLPRTNNRNNDNIQGTLNNMNDTNNSNNTNNTNNTNINIEEGQGYDSDERNQALLQSYSQNKNIKFNPLPIDKQIISYMSKQAHNTDKPTDEDQDGLASWKYLEEALLSTWLLILDALLALNVALFGGELQEIMEKGNREANFLMMHYTSKGSKRTLNINLQDSTDKETGTRVVHKWTAQINNKHTKLREYCGRKVERSTPCIVVLPSTTLGYNINRKGILPCLGTYTTITDSHSLSIATKYRNSAGSHMLDRSESHKGFPFTQTLFYLKHFLASDRLMKAKHLHSTSTFKIKGLDLVKSLLYAKDFIVSIDIKEAFYHILLYSEAQKFFVFDATENNTTLWTFIKILRPVMEMAKQMNIRLVAYLDDILIMAKSHKQARADKEKL
ncbi:10905_t:CDS:2, partial [Gigaspora margarita]